METIKKVIRFLYDVVQYFIQKFDDHAVGAFAAQASFFTIISFFPFVMLLTAILKDGETYTIREADAAMKRFFAKRK